MTADIKVLYCYGNPPPAYDKYAQVAFDAIPTEILEQCKLPNLVHNRWVYLDKQKDMPSLKQTGKGTNNRLTDRLDKCRGTTVPGMPALWRHQTGDITYVLYVDSFGVKYTDKSVVDHIIDALRHMYTISEDWKGEVYTALTFVWKVVCRQVCISIPGYIAGALLRFK